jgi:hypothetical protein
MGDLFDLFKPRQKNEQILKHILKKIEAIEKKLEDKKEEKENTQEEEIQENLNINHTEQKYILIQEPQKKQEKRDELIEEVHKNKKEIVKLKILEESKKGRLSPQELKSIIVDKHKYCSKATFYRYIYELKKTKKITSMQVNNKEILYNSSYE